MNRFITRIYSAIENKEDEVLNQIERDLLIADEDGELDTQEYTMTKSEDGSIDILDKGTGEVSKADITDNEVSVTESDIPINSIVTWEDEAGNEVSGRILSESDNYLEVRKPNGEKLNIRKDLVKLLGTKEYSTNAKFIGDSIIFRIGDYDVEYNIKSKKVKLLDDKLKLEFFINSNKSLKDFLAEIKSKLDKLDKKMEKRKQFSNLSEPVQKYFTALNRKRHIQRRLAENAKNLSPQVQEWLNKQLELRHENK